MAEEAKPVTPFRLRGIYLRESHIQMAESFDPTIPGQQLSGRYRIAKSNVTRRQTDFEGAESLIAYEFHTAFDFVQTSPLTGEETDEEIDKKTLAKIYCSYTVQYAVVGGEPDEETILQWATKQVVFQLWPYFREFCQDINSKMSLPPTPIPFLEINLVEKKRPDEIELNK